MVVLLAGSGLDRIRGGGRLWRAVMIGLAGGLLAAVAYDLFRLPFVFAREWGLDRLVPPMNLFKVFPRFGAMILGQPVEQASYSLPAHLIGWLYHFSNGATFGVMYVAMIGDGARRHWAWAVLMALALELGMLLTPYPQVFHIAVTPRFIAAPFPHMPVCLPAAVGRKIPANADAGALCVSLANIRPSPGHGGRGLFAVGWGRAVPVS